MLIATGHEREELEAEIEGRKRFDMDAPAGPFGTKETPALVRSYYDKRIVGCPGGEGEDEHDVVWLWLEKDRPHECSVCSQYFMDIVTWNLEQQTRCCCSLEKWGKFKLAYSLNLSFV